MTKSADIRVLLYETAKFRAERWAGHALWVLMHRVEWSSDCWRWTGGVWPNGYGDITMRRGVIVRGSHRVIWTLCHGMIPEGLQVLHHCDRPHCCNPEHLYLGTRFDNMRDKSARGRWRGPQNIKLLGPVPRLT